VQQGRHIAHKFESGWEVGVIKVFDKMGVVIHGPLLKKIPSKDLINIKKKRFCTGRHRETHPKG
jgi:hypothetical protein